MEKVVTYELNDQGYGIIRLNRADKRNAISKEMVILLEKYIDEAMNQEIKFLVLTASEGEYFCAGGDLNNLHGDLSPDEAFADLSAMKNVLEKIVKFPVPVIALLNGNALGGGCELATACDIRIAKEGTSFGFIQSKIGILPGWGGGAILYEKVAKSFALDWLMRGDLYKANELLEKGWLHHVIRAEEWDDQEQILKAYTQKSIKQMHLLKKQYQTNIKMDELLLRMDEELRGTADLWDSPEHKTAVQNFLARKK
ncbi:enoyl-CoA hydratase/isomerase family protein [Oceanobacillus sp. CAU 1775]